MYLQIALHNIANAPLFAPLRLLIYWMSNSHRLYLRTDFILSKRFFFHFFSFVLFVISVCLGVINHGMLLANRRSSSNRAPSSIFFGLRRTQRCPRHVYPIIVMSSVSRFIRPRREWSGCDVPPARPIRASTTRAVIVHSGKLHFLRVVATRLRILRRRRVYNVKVRGIRWGSDTVDFSAYPLLKIYYSLSSMSKSWMFWKAIYNWLG